MPTLGHAVGAWRSSATRARPMTRPGQAPCPWRSSLRVHHRPIAQTLAHSPLAPQTPPVLVVITRLNKGGAVCNLDLVVRRFRRDDGSFAYVDFLRYLGVPPPPPAASATEAHAGCLVNLVLLPQGCAEKHGVADSPPDPHSTAAKVV